MEATQLVLTALEGSYSTIRRATDDLSDANLYHLPTPDSNSIAWLIWHLSRWKDRCSALFADEPQVWVSQGWAGKLGMEAEAAGLRDTPEQVAAFKPNRELLFGYAEAAQNASMKRMSGVTSEDLEREFEYPGPGSQQPGSVVLARMLSDFMQHTGQVGYIRGMITGRGWQPF